MLGNQSSDYAPERLGEGPRGDPQLPPRSRSDETIKPPDAFDSYQAEEGREIVSDSKDKPEWRQSRSGDEISLGVNTWKAVIRHKTHYIGHTLDCFFIRRRSRLSIRVRISSSRCCSNCRKWLSRCENAQRLYTSPVSFCTFSSRSRSWAVFSDSSSLALASARCSPSSSTRCSDFLNSVFWSWTPRDTRGPNIRQCGQLVMPDRLLTTLDQHTTEAVSSIP